MYILQKRNSKTFSKNFALKHCDHSFQFFLSSQLFALFPLPNINLPSISSLVKSTFQNTTTSHDKKKDTIRQGKNPNMKAEQSNPIRERVSIIGKRVKNSSAHFIKSSSKPPN